MYREGSKSSFIKWLSIFKLMWYFLHNKVAFVITAVWLVLKYLEK